MKDALLQKVQQTIECHQMLAAGETVVLAVSGGIDSMVLLHLFLHLRPSYHVSLHVVHVDHCLRGAESAAAAVFVRRHCERHDLPATIAVADGEALRGRPGGSLQDAARDLRYRLLHRVADEQGADRIAFGHHRDDQAETVLMNLLRGTGTRGLGGIPPVRGRIIRPMIECAREEIERYAFSEGIPYVEDSSNDSLSYTRNRIRLELLPELAKRYNPRVAEALASVATILEAEDAFLDRLTAEQLPAVVTARSAHELVLSVTRTATLPAALRRRIIRRGLRVLQGDRPALRFQQTLAVERLLLNKGAKGTMDLAGGIRATRAGDSLIFSVRGSRSKEKDLPAPLAVPGWTDVPAFSIRLLTDIIDREATGCLTSDPWVACLDAGRAGSDLFVRAWEPGDRMIPLGMHGHKKLQDVFVDAKVPRHHRRSVPLLVSRGEIAWIVGLRVDERFKVTDSTRRLLRVRAVRIQRGNQYGVDR